MNFFKVVSAATREIIGKRVVIPSLQRNTARIKTFVINSDYLLVAFLANNDTGISPAKIVLVPERVNRQDEGINRKCEHIDEHPSYMLPLPFQEKDQSL